MSERPMYTPDYVRRLLVERHHILAALTNQGGSIILRGTAATTEQAMTYSTLIDNDYHLDLLDATEFIGSLPADQRKALLMWADGLSSQQAADWFHVTPSAIRMRRKRAIEQVAGEMSIDTEGAES